MSRIDKLASLMSLWELLRSGGFIMVPLAICSLLVWVVIFERAWYYRSLGRRTHAFFLEAAALLLRDDMETFKRKARTEGHDAQVPLASVLLHAVERRESKEARLRKHWKAAAERHRLELNQSLRGNLWILGTIGSSAPFIGLFGTVVGILESFQDIATTGSGGFTIVAAGISKALIATAVGIVVAVVAVLAYNAFQTRVAKLVADLKLKAAELYELLETGE